MTRSKPRSAEERRREIIAAAIPLIEQEGFAVSTKRIADAAGIAEGTIFRAFPTKDELLRAALATYLNPASTVAQIDAIGRDTGLDDRISQVLAIVQASASRIHMATMELRRQGELPERQSGCSQSSGHHHFASQGLAVRDAIARLLAPDEADLSVDATTAATFIFSIGVASLMVAVVMPTNPDTLVNLTLRALRGTPGDYAGPSAATESVGESVAAPFTFSRREAE